MSLAIVTVSVDRATRKRERGEYISNILPRLPHILTIVSVQIQDYLLYLVKTVKRTSHFLASPHSDILQ